MPSVSPLQAFFLLKLAFVRRFFRLYAFECLLIFLILYMCISRGLHIGVSIHDPDRVTEAGSVLSISAIVPAGFLAIFSVSSVWEGGSKAPLRWPKHSLAEEEGSISSRNVSQLGRSASKAAETTHAIKLSAPASEGFDDFNTVGISDDPAPHINNLTLVLSPDYAKRKKLPAAIVRAKKQRVERYLTRFAPLAQAEMRAYGIPASITLAQGLLESNAGDSKLARQSKNHFGIKCRSKCLGCTCRNYGDDTRYDMFRVFDAASESYREHSLLLGSERYKRLHAYGSDYKKWAKGLKACGYATDKKYAEKLIKIIEQLGLERYDHLGTV